MSEVNCLGRNFMGRILWWDNRPEGACLRGHSRLIVQPSKVQRIIIFGENLKILGIVLQVELFRGNCLEGKSLGSNCPGGSFIGDSSLWARSLAVNLLGGISWWVIVQGAVVQDQLFRENCLGVKVQGELPWGELYGWQLYGGQLFREELSLNRFFTPSSRIYEHLQKVTDWITLTLVLAKVSVFPSVISKSRKFYKLWWFR